MDINMETQKPEDVAAYNSRSLNTLSRAIALGSAEGEFALILVRCNYSDLQWETIQSLSRHCPIPLQTLRLSPSATTLYGTIKEELNPADRPSVLMVVGLESVLAIDELLTRLNQERPLFLEEFHFPLVLWVADDLLHKLSRFCPDFKSWGPPSIKFAIAPDRAVALLREKAEILFQCILDAGADRIQANAVLELLSDNHRRESTWALQDIQRSGNPLDPELQACLDFVRGWDAYTRDALETAREHYESSLAFWQSGAPGDSPSKLPNRALERAGCVLFYLGVCWHRAGVLHGGAIASAAWEEARRYFQACVEAFDRCGRADLVAKFINALGEVLQRQEDIAALEPVAARALSLHDRYPDPIAQAQDRGFLAQVALCRARWAIAKEEALRALEILGNAYAAATTVCEYTCLHWAWCYHRGWYLLLLGRSRAALGEISVALQILETAQAQTKPEYDPPLYLRIVQELRSLYCQSGEGVAALECDRRYRAIAYQYRLSAFIGGQPLLLRRHPINPARVLQKHSPVPSVLQDPAAAKTRDKIGRFSQIHHLLERISRDDYKLTIVCGQPGVGKTSLMRAGLAPALAQRAIGVKVALPVVVQVNADWVAALCRGLVNALADAGLSEIAEAQAEPSLPAVLERLWNNVDANLLTVLILDWVEEDSHYTTTREFCQAFDRFLGECLDIPFLKLILCWRDEYLPAFLRDNRLQSLKLMANSQGEGSYYHLENLSLDEARIAIAGAIEGTPYSVDPALRDRLVRDLAEGGNRVRSLMLQIVGTQLEAEQITTLDDYLRYGGVEKLLERFMEAAIAYWGNQDNPPARLILHGLAQHSPHSVSEGECPRKTRTELAEWIGEGRDRLDAVLDGLVSSGLVLCRFGLPEKQYQLVDRRFVRAIANPPEFLQL